jgi:hypothetical protein
MSFIYIASPYTHPDSRVRQERYLQASYYVVQLLSHRKFPYSPIVANHHLSLEFGLKHRAIDWMAYNFAMLSSAKELHVLALEGWNESLGVTAEINFWRAARQGEPFHLIDMKHRNRNSGEFSLCAPALKDG